MALNVTFQMDHPAGFNPRTDSTLMIALEAQARGHHLHYYQPQSLSAQGNQLMAAAAHKIRFFDDHTRWFEQSDAAPLALASQQVLLMRNDPPFDMRYLSATYLLDYLPSDVAAFNPPAYVRDHPEKTAILAFPEFIPPTLISRDLDQLRQFRDTQGSIILKPLYGYGGRSVFLFHPDDANLDAFLEHYFTGSPEPLMAQRFLPEVKGEDRRIILIDGQVRAVVGRIPAAGEVRANFRVGGTAAKATLNTRQRSICDRVGEKLHAAGVIFAGLDLIGDYLTEINITSPTGLRAAQSLYGTNLAHDIWDAIEAKL